MADGDRRGRAACRALAEVTDAWLRDCFAAATGGHHRGLALVAVGGYGRGELAPGSDLDLWLVHEGREAARRDLAAVAESVWYPLWDAGLKLGHALRSTKQALALASEDLDTATSALSARHLAGDADVTFRLSERALAQWRKRSGRWLVELGRRVVERHVKAGEVAFLLEPDVKEARGGLRDVHALHWAESARRVLLGGDDDALAGAEDVLLDVRVELHRATGRASDRLLLERQDEVGRAMGQPDADALMAALAAAGRTVAWTGDEIWGRVGSSLAGPTGRVARRDRELGSGLVLRDGEVHVASELAGTGSGVLRAAAAAARARARIDRASLEALGRSAPVLDGPWPEGARHALVELLGTGTDALPVLESLDQRRLLERILPEWAPVRSRPQRNAYHRFTVDRHLCESAANAAGLTSRVGRPDLLLVGAWLHDLGKGYPGDHSAAGTELMATVATRMGFTRPDVEVLCDLVRHHLLLPDVATRRDLGDDEVIEATAATVGSVGLLELLAALTEADSLATGPSAWGAWKAELVATLVDRVTHVLSGGQAEEVTGEGFPDEEVAGLMARRATVVRGLGADLTVVAPDRPGLFTRVAGALALAGLNVRAADAASNEEGMAASRFRVERGHPDLDWDAVVEQVRLALDGRVAVEARLADRARAARRRAPSHLARAPSVRIDNQASSNATVVEVHAPDGVGVLYRITAALAELDLDIRLAKVATLGHEVVDTFYVRTVSREQITDHDHQRELRRAIVHRLA